MILVCPSYGNTALAGLRGAVVLSHAVAKTVEANLITIGLGRAGIRVKLTGQAVIAGGNRC